MIPATGSRRILQEPVLFLQIPAVSRPEQAGTGRKHTVPETVVFQIFLITGLTQELVSFQPETHRNAAVSTRKLTESTRIRVETNGMHNRIFLPFYRSKIYLSRSLPNMGFFLNCSEIFNPHYRIFLD